MGMSEDAGARYTDLPVTKMAFERRYSDDSGVEFGVSLNMDNVGEEIKFECVDEVTFPLSQIGFLRDALDKIARETDNE